MTQAQHTPGPWIIDRYIVKSGDDKGAEMLSIKGVCSISQQPTGYKQNEIDEANARLIAAAPELLEAAIFAIKELRQHIDYGRDNNPITYAHDRLDAAIAQAKGE